MTKTPHAVIISALTITLKTQGLLNMLSPQKIIAPIALTLAIILPNLANAQMIMPDTIGVTEEPANTAPREVLGPESTLLWQVQETPCSDMTFRLSTSEVFDTTIDDYSCNKGYRIDTRSPDSPTHLVETMNIETAESHLQIYKLTASQNMPFQVFSPRNKSIPSRDIRNFLIQNELITPNSQISPTRFLDEVNAYYSMYHSKNEGQTCVFGVVYDMPTPRGIAHRTSINLCRSDLDNSTAATWITRISDNIYHPYQAPEEQ